MTVRMRMVVRMRTVMRTVSNTVLTFITIMKTLHLLRTFNTTQQASSHYTIIIMARYHAITVSSNNYHTDLQCN